MITPIPPHPAALATTKETKTLVIADLHLGWEIALSQQGIHVPTQTPRILAKLLDLISTHQPDHLLILGDVKNTIATAEKAEWHDVPDFFVELRKKVRDIVIIRGNHDGNLESLLPENVQLLPSTGTAIGDVGFFHGHRWPSPRLLRCRTVVMGHVHPVVVLRDRSGFRMTRQVWVKARCDGRLLAEILKRKSMAKFDWKNREDLFPEHKKDIKTSQLFIMPSFNDFLGGRPINERKMVGNEEKLVPGPLLHSEAVDMKKAEAYLLDGTFLGTLEQLRQLS